MLMQVGEDDVMSVFPPHRALDCIVGRVGYLSYAFFPFCPLEALHESKVKGSLIQIEFVWPVNSPLPTPPSASTPTWIPCNMPPVTLPVIFTVITISVIVFWADATQEGDLSSRGPAIFCGMGC